MESAGGFFIFQLVIRIICSLICVNKAKELNRNTVGWGIFGFVFIIIAVIWLYCLKPITKWENE